MAANRKHTLELARLCRKLAGYDLLGAIDHHWHRTGYPCGIMNEFYEMKPGESVEDVLKYNGESVVLLDHNKKFVYGCNEQFSADLHISFFGASSMQKPQISWQLVRQDNSIVLDGNVMLASRIVPGTISKIATIKFRIPMVQRPEECMLYVHVSSREYRLDNKWKLWIFPQNEANLEGLVIEKTLQQKVHALHGIERTSNRRGEGKLLVVSRINKDVLKKLCSGANVLLMGTAHFPARKVTFQIGRAGRGDENIATVIYDHPIFHKFPHHSWCDWQFYRMIEEGGSTVVFNKLSIPFAPIVEFVSFKNIFKQASLFEFCVGQGRLFVFSLAIPENDPAACYLFCEILNYLADEEKQVDAIGITPEELMAEPTDKVIIEGATDTAFDINLKKMRSG
jgi:hypothetical protein